MESIARALGIERAAISLSASVLLLWLMPARPAVSQVPPTEAPKPQTPAQPVDQDPLGRSTPYGTVMGFARAAQLGEFSRAVQYLDTRKAGDEAEELARELQIVLDRGLTSGVENVSRRPEGDLQDGLRITRDRVGIVELSSRKLEILLDRIDRRDQSPVWLFSSETLALVPEAAGEMGSFEIEKYVPSPLVEITLFSIPLFRWINMILFLALALFLGSLITRALVPPLRRFLHRVTGEEDERVVVSLRPPIRLILVAVAIRLFTLLSLSLVVREFWTRVALTVAVIGLAWLLIQFNNIVSHLLDKRLRRRRVPGKIAMLALIRRLLNAVVAIVAALWLLHEAGVDLTAILTGLGVGGIAVALAAQKTLENLFGGMMIITDEPVRMGDFCRIGDQMGTVEDIGLRSTRIRTLSRTVISIPNGQLAVMNVENFSLRDKFWLRHAIGLRYETTPDQLRYVLAEVRTVLYSHPRVETDGARIRFVGFGDCALNLEVFAYVRATEMPEFLGIQEDLLLRIMDVIARGGTAIAFPSQTTYLSRDTPLDPQRTQEAITQVQRWRERGELPFPDFDPSQVGQMRDRIEYPPLGSSAWSESAVSEGHRGDQSSR